MQIIYDPIAHIFFCSGHVTADDFMVCLWEQWDTDYSSANLYSQIRHSFIKLTSGGYWEECSAGVDGAEESTVIGGDVVNLGPAVCPRCNHLMALSSRRYFGYMVSEDWECRQCGYEMGFTGRSSKRRGPK